MVFFGAWASSLTTTDQVKHIDVRTPTEGAAWDAGTTQTIRWAAKNLADTQLGILIWEQDRFVSRPASAIAFAGDGSMDWDISENIGDGSAYRAFAFGGFGVYLPTGGSFLLGVSPPFTITGSQPRPTFEITAPNGGATLTAGERGRE